MPHGTCSGAVQSMTRQALRLEEREARANRICCGHCWFDVERRPALQWRNLALEPLQLVRPLLAADRRRCRSGPNDIERSRAFSLTRKHGPARTIGLDSKPGDRL